MIRIVTDTGADYTPQEASLKGLDIVHLSIHFKDLEYLSEKDNESFSDFYTHLKQGKALPTTSQPPPGRYLEVFEDAKAKGETMIVICLSQNLSGTYQSACIAKEMADYDRIHVLDSRQGIMAQRALVDYAIKLRDKNHSATEIIAALENVKEDIVVFGVIETLKYLQMGGRISKAGATVGEVLSVKPIVTLDDGAVIMENKKRGSKAAARYVQDKLVQLGYDDNYPVYFGYSDNKERGQVFMDETIDKFKIKNAVGPYGIGGTIGTHVGPGGLAIAFFKKK